MTNTEELAAFGQEVRELYERAGVEGWTSRHWLQEAKAAAIRRGIADDNGNPEIDFFELWVSLKYGSGDYLRHVLR